MTVDRRRVNQRDVGPRLGCHWSPVAPAGDAVSMPHVALTRLSLAAYGRRMKDFRGKIAVVTGGGTGMGRELALKLAACSAIARPQRGVAS